MNEIVAYSELEKMAGALSRSGLFNKNPDQMIALMLIASAEGIHPAIAAMEYDVIQGRPALKGQAALARFQQAGGKIEWQVKSDAEAKAVFTHPQGGSLTVSWTMERARKMGLDGKDNWKKQPGVMLSWRCVAEGVRAVFPACLNRMYLAEEVQDFEPMKNVTPEPVQIKLAPVVEYYPDPSAKPEVDWSARAAELTTQAGIDPEMKKAIWKDCGMTAEAYCKKVEAIMAAQVDAEAQGGQEGLF